VWEDKDCLDREVKPGKRGGVFERVEVLMGGLKSESKIVIRVLGSSSCRREE